MRLRFSLTQHSYPRVRDDKLLQSLVEYLGCGIYYARSEHNFGEFIVSKNYRAIDITDKIIPFFDKYPLVGVKRLNYLDFCKPVADLIKNKAHLTTEGLSQIKIIKPLRGQV